MLRRAPRKNSLKFIWLGPTKWNRTWSSCKLLEAQISPGRLKKNTNSAHKINFCESEGEIENLSRSYADKVGRVPSAEMKTKSASVCVRVCFPTKDAVLRWRKSSKGCMRCWASTHRDELSSTIHFLNRTARWSVSLYYNGWFVWLKNKFWSSKKFSPIYNGVRDAPGARTHSHRLPIHYPSLRSAGCMHAPRSPGHNDAAFPFAHTEQVHLWPMNL